MILCNHTSVSFARACCYYRAYARSISPSTLGCDLPGSSRNCWRHFIPCPQVLHRQLSLSLSTVTHNSHCSGLQPHSPVQGPPHKKTFVCATHGPYNMHRGCPLLLHYRYVCMYNNIILCISELCVTLCISIKMHTYCCLALCNLSAHIRIYRVYCTTVCRRNTP